MNSLDELRARYGRLGDADLQALAAVDGENLTPEARQVLAEEVARRRLFAGATFAPTPPVVMSPSTAEGQWTYPKAKLGARLLAYLIDGVIGVMLPVMAASIGLITSHGRFTFINGLLLVSSVVWAIYYSFTKDGHDEGRSIGKRATGLMVVNIKTNKPCSLGESALRSLILTLLNAIPLLGWLIEPLMVLASEDGRRAGDRAAGTQVIEAAAYRPTIEEIIL